MAPPAGFPGAGARGPLTIGRRFKTDFPGTESPVSEGSLWRRVGSLWTGVDMTPGIAFGTQSGMNGVDDSYAYLDGFAPDQWAEARIRKAGGISILSLHEVKILLRWGDSSSLAWGYECNISYDGLYCEINRWEGPFGNPTTLVHTLPPAAPVTGDYFSAQMVGNVITSFLNGAPIATYTDTSVGGAAKYASGQPGMGFYRSSAIGAFNGDFGFECFRAASL